MLLNSSTQRSARVMSSQRVAPFRTARVPQPKLSAKFSIRPIFDALVSPNTVKDKVGEKLC